MKCQRCGVRVYVSEAGKPIHCIECRAYWRAVEQQTKVTRFPFAKQTSDWTPRGAA